MKGCAVVVATFGQRYEAELARGYLEDDGIPAAVAVDDAGGAYAGLTFSPAPARVMVRPEDFRRARRLLVEVGMVAGGTGERESADRGDRDGPGEPADARGAEASDEG